MIKLTASNIVAFINQLDKKVAYNYLNPRNKGQIEIVEVLMPEGPIRIRRWDSSKGEVQKDKKIDTISPELIWRIANALVPNQPINFDRVLGGSYNTRSVLEALLAHTPEFQFCYPGRIETTGGNPTVKRGHKHLVWTPNEPHKIGITKETKTDIVISEVPVLEVFYDNLAFSSNPEATALDINIQRRHAQIQIALYFIGLQLNFKTWVAQNDKSIVYQNKRLIEFEGIISDMGEGTVIHSFKDAVRAALLIDCIWFKNGKLMPAVMEIEHSTGVTSGLTRMKNFKDIAPPFPTRYVIVAPDEDRDKVIKEANKIQFQDLDTRFFPYSAVEELYALCQKRKLKGVTEEFLDCYMEKVLMN